MIRVVSRAVVLILALSVTALAFGTLLVGTAYAQYDDPVATAQPQNAGPIS